MSVLELTFAELMLVAGGNEGNGGDQGGTGSNGGGDGQGNGASGSADGGYGFSNSGIVEGNYQVAQVGGWLSRGVIELGRVVATWGAEQVLDGVRNSQFPSTPIYDNSGYTVMGDYGGGGYDPGGTSSYGGGN